MDNKSMNPPTMRNSKILTGIMPISAAPSSQFNAAKHILTL
jgi:hypothetical protein